MKTLILLRHAKSGWDDSVSRDFDRPLNAKGRRAAAMMGRHLKSLGIALDHVVASPALRVTETLDEVAGGYGGDIAARWDQRLYLASAATLLDIVRALPDSAQTVLVAGHNPGLEDLALMLVPEVEGDPLRAAVLVKFPTATIAEVRFDHDWRSVGTGSGRLHRFVRPRDLDPSLGPDR